MININGNKVLYIINRFNNVVYIINGRYNLYYEHTIYYNDIIEKSSRIISININNYLSLYSNYEIYSYDIN